MTYQAIQTRYIGPSNICGSRIKATAAFGSVTVAYDAEFSDDVNHSVAAEKLAEKYGWGGAWFGGTLKNGNRVFVQTDVEEAADWDNSPVTPLFITSQKL